MHVSNRPITIEDLERFQLVSDPQPHPGDGSILFSLKRQEPKNKAITQLHLIDRNKTIRQLTQGEKSASGGRWSPNGSTIAFVSTRTGGASQIHLLPSVGEAFALTQLAEGSISGLQWSPDGKTIGFLYRATDPNFTEAAKKHREENGLSDPPKEIDDIWYRLDGDGYFLSARYELWVVEVDSKVARKLYAASPTGDYAFSWHPDSSKLVVSHTANARPMAEAPNDQIYIVGMDGSVKQLPGLPKGEKSAPKFSPSGNLISYAGDTSEDDPWGTRNTKMYIVSAEGGEPKDILGHTDYDLNVATLSDTKEAAYGAAYEWLSETELLVQIGWKGEQQLAKLSLDGDVSFVTEGKHSVTLGGLTADKRTVGVVHGHPGMVPELGKLVLGEGLETLTAFNAAWHAEVEVRLPEEHWVKTPDGTDLHFWVITPVGFDPAKQYPAVLEIHGGPHTQYGWTFFHEFQVLAAQGYVVVYSNPRGSKGYGEAHCAAIAGDWGNKDWIDVQVVRDWMKACSFIDEKRMGVMGGSYGGYMTNWVIGNCHDFAGAITDRCVSNMVSMAGNSDFPFNKDGYFKGIAWGDHEDIKELWRQSPIAYFKNVKTPTLVIHSEGDLRCNVEQGEQVFTALQQEGVPSRFVRYPFSTSHGMSRSGPADLRKHRLNEIVSWWKKYL